MIPTELANKIQDIGSLNPYSDVYHQTYLEIMHELGELEGKVRSPEEALAVNEARHLFTNITSHNKRIPNGNESR